MTPTNNHTLFFVKYPQAGQVKTRLAHDIGSKAAVDLYRCFVLNILDTLKKVCTKVWICYWPWDCRIKFSRWLGDSYEYIPQNGEDLGQRIQSCFRQVFLKGAKRTLVLGSDIPDITERTITIAFNQLETHDVVIGPTYDGGYYLIGFRQETFIPQVFDNMAWSRPDVYGKTMDIIKNDTNSIFILEKLHDIDTAEDVKRFISRNAFGASNRLQSMKYLGIHLSK